MSDIAAGGARAQGAPRWMMVLLIVSLAVNFLIIGLTAGAFLGFRGPPLTASVTPNLLGYASMLPQDRRKALWDETEAERTHLRPFRRDVRAAREETLKALTAEPFDRQKFMEAQARQAQAEQRAREAVQALYAKIASGMTPAERLAFTHWRERMRPPGSNMLDEGDAAKKLPASVK